MRSAVHTALCWLGFAIPLLFCACHGQQRQQMLMHLFVGQPSKQAELKELIEKFDSDCELNAIVHLLGISSAQVANLKKDVNKALFGEDTAKTIYKNLVSRYSFLSF